MTRLICSVQYHLLDLCETDRDCPSEDDATSCAGLVKAGDGALHFITGPHSGVIDLTVAVTPHDPGVLSPYGDVVEISVQFASSRLTVVEGAGEHWHDLPPLPAPGWYRARYHVELFDEAASADVAAAEPVGRHVLQLWPAPRTAPRVVKLTSAGGRYWLSARPLTG